jgi:hypothetical protein
LSEAQQLSLYYPDLSRGWGPTAPPRALTPDSPRIWRETRNMWAYDGLLRRRPAAISAGLATQPPGVGVSPSTTADGECAVFIHCDLYPSGAARTTDSSGACADEFTYNAGAELVVLVTNRQAFLTKDGGTTWTNVTPTYTTGTVTATNGSATVTGVGTAWSTRGITAYQLIVIDGGTYQICSVNSDTSITLTANFTGATAAGKAYSIRRTWRGGYTLDATSLIFCKIYNQNLYIAGTFIGRADGEARPTVIRVSDLLSATPTTAYLTSTFDLTGTLDLIAAPTLTSISGLQILQDSRLVLSGSDSTLYYSSNLDQAVWSVSPGGFTIDTQVDGPITALGQIGNVLTAHHRDGITLCYPQAQSDPPLALQRSQAHAGCHAPRTLCAASGVERYLGADGQIYQFDLSASVAIGDDIRAELTDVDRGTLREAFHASYHAYRDEYFLFYEAAPITNVYVLQARQGQWWRWVLPYPVTAMANDAPSESRDDGFALIGVPNLDAVESVPGTFTVVNMLWAWTEAASTDTITSFDSGLTAAAFQVTTDALDLGQPLMLKSVQRVIVWFTGTANGDEDVVVWVTHDGFLTGQSNPRTVSLSTTQERAYQFCFEEAAESAAPTIRVASASNNTFRAQPTRMLVIMEAAGSMEDIEL